MQRSTITSLIISICNSNCNGSMHTVYQRYNLFHINFLIFLTVISCYITIPDTLKRLELDRIQQAQYTVAFM